ncbi:pyrin-like isoform X2 [Emydura macquarii macquarii]|uniref:pyrin-like isoform X2 n=1 Tax=Emydura macquarii macquarii TaxID=1129001 RepID=UPI00352B47B5
MISYCLRRQHGEVKARSLAGDTGTAGGGFKEKLSEIKLKEGYAHLPLEILTNADPPVLIELLFFFYGNAYGMKVAAGALRAINQGNLAERLMVWLRAACATSRNNWWRNLVCCCPSTRDEGLSSWQLIEHTQSARLKEAGDHVYYQSAALGRTEWRGGPSRWLSKELSGSASPEEAGATPRHRYLPRASSGQEAEEITCQTEKCLSTGPAAEEATGGGEGNIRADSTADQGKKDKCKLCPTEEDPPERIKPKIVRGPDWNQEMNRVHLPRAGSFCCSETELGLEVRAAVTIEYEYDSWDRCLSAAEKQQWMVAGPLFNIHVELAGAMTAVHLPHFLCLAGGEADVSRVRIAHFIDGGLTLEEPTRNISLTSTENS